MNFEEIYLRLRSCLGFGQLWLSVNDEEVVIAKWVVKPKEIQYEFPRRDLCQMRDFDLGQIANQMREQYRQDVFVDNSPFS